MKDLKQHYLDEMIRLSNDLQIKYYRKEKIDIHYRRECEIKINELKENFNGMSIEINKMKELQHLEQARRVNGRIKCNLTGHVYQAKAQVIPSPARKRNHKYKYPPLHHEKVAGLRNRLSMLATGRYPQCRSRFLRYIDTRQNGDALRKCILSGPYKPTTVLVQAVAATDDSLAIPEHTTVETPMNMTPENKAHFQAEKEAIL
nr:hypothetical protein [Tanacetum cinerariifolium]